MRRADRLDLVVAALDAFDVEHLVEQQRERGVRRVDRHGGAAELFVRLDLRLHEQAVEPLVAAHEDEQVGLVVLDLRHRVVDAAMGDVVAALGEPVAQLVGVRRVDQLDREIALLVEALRLGGELRRGSTGPGRR